MKKNSVKALFITLVVAVVIVWSLVVYAAVKPQYDHSVKAECTYWCQEYCIFEVRYSGDCFEWEFNSEEINTGSLNDCTTVNCGNKYLLRMNEGVDDTTTIDDEIISYTAISLIEYLQ